MSTVAEPSYRKRIGYQSVLLGGFTAIASIFLVSSNLATRDVIAQRLQEDLLESLSQVIPTDQYQGSLLDHTIEFELQENQSMTIYRGVSDGKVSALAYEVIEPGYSGDIHVLLGLNNKGVILGARVLSHTETPGLGDKIEVQKDNWILGFNGLSKKNPLPTRWKVKKDGGEFDAFSGATITPRAVVKAIYQGLEFFDKNQFRLLTLEPAVQNNET